MIRPLALLAVAIALILAAGLLARFEYAPLPGESVLANPERNPLDAVYDVLGRKIGRDEFADLARTIEGRELLSPAQGAVKIDTALVRLGRDAFYRETFGNEVFLTDVLGMLDGGLTPWKLARALAALGGSGTSDLKVRLAQPVTIARRTYAADEEISTGLDVPAGGFMPLGIKVVYDGGRIRAGITCAACHTTIDREGRVIEGAPNTDFNLGFLLALSSNSASYYAHTTMPSLAPFQTDAARTVIAEDGTPQRLPEPAGFEAAVDAMFAAWPPGSFDSTIDLVNNPTSIPDSFTAEGHPFGWTGFAAIGPFRGLSALNNNVHAMNSDDTAHATASRTLFGLDPEVYLGTLLQRAPNPAFRYRPGGPKPSEILARADPTPGSPGLNTFAVIPGFPSANYVTTSSLVSTRPRELVGRALDAMSAFQDTLKPPGSAFRKQSGEGRRIFERAGCARCHSGPAYTNHAVLPAPDLGVEPTRARALAATEKNLAPPFIFAPDTPYPPPADARLISIPIEPGLHEALRLAWAHGGTPGGYKVKGLIGLAWTPPYLHDSGVSVGPHAERDIGLPGTFEQGIRPDAANSLRALLDRSLREKVVLANRSSERARSAHVIGEGHAFYVDSRSGFTHEEREALIEYLLSLTNLAR